MAEQSSEAGASVALQVHPDDALSLAEVSLDLRNLSFLLCDLMAGSGGTIQGEAGALFALYRNMTQASSRLEEVSRRCLAGQPPGERVTTGATRHPAG
jgi:hypothetical protein